MEHALAPMVPAIALALIVLAVTALGRRLPIPTPILQVVAGLIVGLAPGAAAFRLDPSVVFFVFLPPVLWAAAYFTSFRDFRANARPSHGWASDSAQQHPWSRLLPLRRTTLC